MVAAIHTEGLAKYFGATAALRRLNLEVQEGEVLGYPSGACVRPLLADVDARWTGVLQGSVRHARTGRATSREPAVIRGAVALSR
jgi:ABC-type arginine transport system ATPase subunit